MGQRIAIPTELIQRLKDGDQGALADIMEICYEGLLVYTTRILNDNGAAEEIVSDAFIKLWRFADTLKPAASPMSWLFRVCQNASVDYLRCKKNRRHDSLETLLEDDTWMLGRREHLPDLVIDRLMMEQLLGEVLPGVPPAFRICMELQCEGYEYTEIAADMQIPLGTVKSRIKYGRDRARKLARRGGWDLGTLTCEAHAG